MIKNKYIFYHSEIEIHWGKMFRDYSKSVRSYGCFFSL